MKQRLQFLGIFAVCAVLVLTLFNGAVREILVKPFLQLIWLIRLFADMVPQAAVWAVLLIFAIWMAWRSLASPLDFRRAPWVNKERASSLLSWQHAFEEATKQDDYSRQKLSQRLGHLTTEVFNSHNPENKQTLWECLRDRSHDMPDELRAYLQAGIGTTASSASAKGWGKAKQQHPELQLDPERVLQFLEQRLYLQPDEPQTPPRT
jgi:hypothetical protein